MGSSRLPGKNMKSILGKPMIEQIVERIRHSKQITEIVVATTEREEDDALEKFTKEIDCKVFRGAEQNVLTRVHGAVEENSPDVVVEILGDNPLVHSDLIDEVIDFFSANDLDYAANVTTEYPHAGDIPKFPIGIRVQVLSPAAIEKCLRLAQPLYNPEQTTEYIYFHPEDFKIGYFKAEGKWSSLNRPSITFAVNYQQNFDLISQIFESCYPKNNNFTLQEVFEIFDKNPEWKNLMGPPKN